MVKQHSPCTWTHCHIGMKEALLSKALMISKRSQIIASGWSSLQSHPELVTCYNRRHGNVLRSAQIRTARTNQTLRVPNGGEHVSEIQSKSIQTGLIILVAISMNFTGTIESPIKCWPCFNTSCSKCFHMSMINVISHNQRHRICHQSNVTAFWLETITYKSCGACCGLLHLRCLALGYVAAPQHIACRLHRKMVVSWHPCLADSEIQVKWRKWSKHTKWCKNSKNVRNGRESTLNQSIQSIPTLELFGVSKLPRREDVTRQAHLKHLKLKSVFSHIQTEIHLSWHTDFTPFLRPSKMSMIYQPHISAQHSSHTLQQGTSLRSLAPKILCPQMLWVLSGELVSWNRQCYEMPHIPNKTVEDAQFNQIRWSACTSLPIFWIDVFVASNVTFHWIVVGVDLPSFKRLSKTVGYSRYSYSLLFPYFMSFISTVQVRASHGLANRDFTLVQRLLHLRHRQRQSRHKSLSSPNISGCWKHLESGDCVPFCTVSFSSLLSVCRILSSFALWEPKLG